MAEHSKLFSPSRAEMRLACPGSFRMEELYPEEGAKPYAEEGSAAHHLCERCLKSDENAAKYRDRAIVRVGRGWSILNPGSKRNDGFEVTSEMVEAVQTYLDYVRSHGPAGGERGIEQRVGIIEGVFGTADHIYAVPFGPIYVDDFKYGKGVIVPAEDNPQVMAYALGALLASQYDHDVVRISIIQPRSREPMRDDIPWLGKPVEGVDAWEVSADKLIRWRNEVLIPGIERCKDPDAPLHAGDHCKFCSAKKAGQCPELLREVFDVVPVMAPSLPVPTTLTNEQIGNILDKKAMAESWLDEIAALAARKVEAGETIPGAAGAYKMVAGRSDRKWANEYDAEVFMVKAFGKDAHEQKLLSPAKAEALFKARNLDKAMLAPYIIKPQGKPTLAPATDKRTALPSSAVRAFADIPAADVLG